MAACLYVLLAALPVMAQTLVVKTGETKATISPTMWGIFFEDINFAADGGLYAELVKNRSFEFSMPLMGWQEQKKDGGEGTVLIENRDETGNNPRFARLNLISSQGAYGLVNEGFRGMGIQKDHQYHFSVLARRGDGKNTVMHAELLDEKGNTIGTGSITIQGSEWKQYRASFTAGATTAKGRLRIWVTNQGITDIDMVSLFPQDTWKQRPGGLRADLVQLLADLKPGFLRFPGGCIVEGRDLLNRYQWKKTVGDINQRKLMINRWNTEFSHRAAPDYFQSFGLGFYEYFLLAEDIGASPLPILNCGMACQFNTAEVVPATQLDPFIQDALDLIEFANGDTATTWGRLRAQMGHPAPFGLKMLGVGNEQWGPQYIERYRLFAAAIRQHYPGIKMISSTGPDPDGPKFNYLNDTLRRLQADWLDEHYYRKPEWFLKQATRYDQYDRKGPKIFAGEYAAHDAGVTDALHKNNWKSALAEAAFMTGLERNADVVQMASYAPLLAHVDGWQWAPDLIWFDNLRSYGTPDYYVQKLYARNRGTQIVPILMNNEVIAGQDSLYASACRDAQTGELIIKIANTSPQTQTRQIKIAGAGKLAATAQLTVLQSSDLYTVNSLDAPLNIHPEEQVLNSTGKQFSLNLAPYSFTVFRAKLQ